MERCEGREQLDLLTRRLHAALLDPLDVLGQPVRVSASIGAVFSRERPAEVDELMRAADAAMYRDKHAAPRPGRRG